MSVSPVYAYELGNRFLVMSADLSRDVQLCKAHVLVAEKEGAWLARLEESASFPDDEEVYLIEFAEKDVVTHRCRILERGQDKIRVALPTITDRERSKLAPFTGRSDYRVQVNLPVQVRICDGRSQSHQQWPCQLHDLSRGGMSLVGPINQPFEKGQRVDVRVVSWEYPVRIETEIMRVWKEDDTQRVALGFPEDMTINQRELISTFILQVQRRDSLGRSLPVVEDDL